MTAVVEPECAYCTEPATSRIEPDGGGEPLLVREEHEERGIVDVGSGQIEPLSPQLRLIRGGLDEAAE